MGAVEQEPPDLDGLLHNLARYPRFVLVLVLVLVDYIPKAHSAY